MSCRMGHMCAAALLMGAVFAVAGCSGGDGDGGTAPPVNAAPTLSVQVESGLRVLAAGDPVSLAALAVDPDADPLTYVWRTAPAGWGSFADSTSLSTTWTAGVETGTIRFECLVSDGQNPQVSRLSSFLEIGTAVSATSYTTDQTWVAASSPYVVLQDLTVQAGATLTIEPGVQVYLRPAVSGPGIYDRPLLTVRGTLRAVGTASSLGTSVRFLGGREPFPNPTQHQGIVFEGAGTGLLRWVTVRDGDVGVAQLSSATVSMLDCRIEDNSIGIITGSGASLTLRHSRVADNGVGIQGNTGTLTLRQCNVRDNLGAGLAVNAAGAPAVADVDSSEFRENGSGHVVVDSGGWPVNLTIGHSNLLVIPDGTVSIRIATSLCGLVNSELRGNYWGPNADTASDVLDLFDGRLDCGAGVAGWSLASGDWSQVVYVLGLL